MNKSIFTILCSLLVCVASFGQTLKSKTLLIIDSVPILNSQSQWAKIQPEDIADSVTIVNKDSLRLLGWEQVDAVTYLFTKQFRERSDSVRKIPSLRQMDWQDRTWTWNGKLYSGQYIDYYANGHIQSEGKLVNGQLDGEVVLYYKNGIRQFTINYEEGTRHGIWKQYYKNGALMAENKYEFGSAGNTGKSYFINGQLRYEFRSKKATRYDTSITYFSTGKVRQIKTTKSGRFYPDKKEENLKYYSQSFYEHLWEGNLKKANKDFYNLWRIDSASMETAFKEGQLLAFEFRFDEAIAQFDKVITIEPFMWAGLEQRVLARIKKYVFTNRQKALKDQKDIPLISEDFMLLPEDEKAKVCRDLLLLDDLDINVHFSYKTIPEAMLNHCRKKISN